MKNVSKFLEIQFYVSSLVLQYELCHEKTNFSGIMNTFLLWNTDIKLIAMHGAQFVAYLQIIK